MIPLDKALRARIQLLKRIKKFFSDLIEKEGSAKNV